MIEPDEYFYLVDDNIDQELANNGGFYWSVHNYRIFIMRPINLLCAQIRAT